ncbi:MAG: PAS domain-containing sensor histidine kinase [Firmicutes bacterium HGW-Firmicutes-15]|nr:MAG: PAS domain-containing sensor histidine kinase [Firmicutes bacterium HGW-Firmicutes-15]
MSLAIDTSESKELSQLIRSEATIKALLDASNESAFLYNNQGYVVTLNETAARRLNMKIEDIIGRHVKEIFPIEVANNRIEHINKLVENGKPVRFQDKRDDHYFDNSMVPIMDQDGKVEMLAVFYHDITDHKLAEIKILKQRDELERSNQELEQFAYVASHDLQEPLRKIASFITLLERRYKGALDEDADRYIHYVVDGATRMQGLINDLLTYSRVGKQNVELTMVNCNNVLSHVLRDLEHVITSNDAVITVEDLPKVWGNSVQLRQLFMNLLSNAIKFKGPQIPEIQIKAEQQEGKYVFSFRDNGIGIEPEYKERIFQMFQRLHTKEEYPGTGIGLAVCKKIVDINGGQIWFESENGMGTVFYFSWPMKGRC